MSNRRTGKIARLPYEVRTRVNEMIRDGFTYADIIGWLIAEGHCQARDVNDQNLSNWKEGGFRDWLGEQQRLDDMRLRQEFAMEIVQANEGSKIHEAALQVAANQVYEVLMDYDLEQLKVKLEGDPENYSRLVSALARLSKGGLEFEKYRDQVRQRKDAIAKELEGAKTKGGLAPETIQNIERELKLL